MERAHCIGPQQDQQPKPRLVIVRYLNYANKHILLQHYCRARGLSADCHKLLLFTDYSVEVSKQRKSFAPICSQLHQHNLKFSLAYPAVLRLHSPQGDKMSFTSSADAQQYVESLLVGDMASTSIMDDTPSAPSSPAPSSSKHQISPVKYPSKRGHYASLN